MRRLRLVAFCVAAAALLLASQRAHAAPVLGFNEGDLQNKWSPAVQARIARAGHQAGATSSRVLLHWDQVEPTKDLAGNPSNQNWVSFDRQYAARLSEGIHPLIVIEAAPRWARGLLTCSGEICPPSESHLADWATFAREVATRYPQAAGIQVWNEENLKGQWAVIGGPDPDYYAVVFDRAISAIHQANPAMPVVTGSLTYVTDQRRGMDMREFLDGFYRAGGATHLTGIDGLGLNAYPYINELETLDGQFATIMRQFRSVRDRWDPARKIWITETGVTTTGRDAVSQKEQARGLLNVWDELSSKADIAAVYIHTLIEADWNPDRPDQQGFGLITQTGQAKLAYCAFAERAGTPISEDGCPANLDDLLGIGGGGGGGGGDDPLLDRARHVCRRWYHDSSRWAGADQTLRRTIVAGCVPKFEFLETHDQLAEFKADARAAAKARLKQSSRWRDAGKAERRRLLLHATNRVIRQRLKDLQVF